MEKQFTQRVWDACKKIPCGRVATYKAIAEAIGKPNAARAVGNALNKSPGMPAVPCHRIIKSDGTIGGYRWGVVKKKELLEKEGIKIAGNRIMRL